MLSKELITELLKRPEVRDVWLKAGQSKITITIQIRPKEEKDDNNKHNIEKPAS